jgi:hypothetical protein
VRVVRQGDRAVRQGTQRAYEQRTVTALYAAADQAGGHALAPAERGTERGAGPATDHLSAPTRPSAEQAAEADYPQTPTG